MEYLVAHGVCDGAFAKAKLLVSPSLRKTKASDRSTPSQRSTSAGESRSSRVSESPRTTEGVEYTSRSVSVAPPSMNEELDCSSSRVSITPSLTKEEQTEHNLFSQVSQKLMIIFADHPQNSRGEGDGAAKVKISVNEVSPNKWEATMTVPVLRWNSPDPPCGQATCGALDASATPPDPAETHEAHISLKA